MKDDKAERTQQPARLWLFKNADMTIVRFGVVGLISTFVDFGLFTWLTGAGLPVAGTNVISYLSSLVVHFSLNHMWTFAKNASPSPLSSRITRYAVVQAMSLLLSTLTVAVLAHFMPAPLAKAISIPLIFLWNYFASRRWVFGVKTIL